MVNYTVIRFLVFEWILNPTFTSIEATTTYNIT